MRAKLAAAVLGWLLGGAGLCAQVCRLSVAGLNRERRLAGPVAAECPNLLHSAPFGNWGATSNFGGKLNGRQFDGWCHDTRVCDNAGACWTDCRDGWYEWNSCTTHPLYSPPNCTLYNAAGCTEQVSTTGVNVLGTQLVDLAVSCPRDTDGDGVADTGGCSDLRSYSHGTNFITLYELDPGGPDELIQTMYFPETPVALNCGLFDCPAAGSEWVAPVAWDPPAPRKVFAEMAAVVNFGIFLDSGGACRGVIAPVRSYSAAGYGEALAPDSLASAFGSALARSTQAAGSIPLPLELGGVTVTVTDSGGGRYRAPMIYASPSQINWVVPAGVRPGSAAVTVAAGGRVLATGAVQIERVAPGLFTANADGRGAPAAVAVRVRPDGSQEVTPAFQCSGGPGTCEARPLEGPRPGEQLILLLFGTGLRGRAALSDVEVTLGGMRAEVLYAGPQPEFPGLDQVNVRVPGGLAGRVEVVLTVEGVSANRVSIELR
jgi:uncharacterized protein (TIGR03437 family)